jgi:hypothetical protein
MYLDRKSRESDFFYTQTAVWIVISSERSLPIDGVFLMKDRLLVTRCRQGSRDALRRIYEKYRDSLLNFGDYHFA